MRDKERTGDGGRVAGAHQPLADLAERQHGVVSLRQLEALGYSRDAASRAARAGRLHRVHRACLVPGDCAVKEAIPVTGLARTLLDLAADLSAERLDRVIERAEEQGLFDLRAIDALLVRNRGHRGKGPLRRALSIYRDDPAFTRSRLERRFRDLVKSAGLPAPSMNFWEGEFELDAYWRPERFVVELDVYETHGSRASFESDRVRHEELKLVGIEMIRVTGPRLEREPDKVIARVAALLEQRRRQLSATGAVL
jgi:hypothetical protein